MEDRSRPEGRLRSGGRRMRELAGPVERWREAGVDAVLVRAVEVTGFGAGQYDNALVRSARGESAGAILRGVSDDAVASAVTALFEDPDPLPREVVVAVSDPQATAGGLSCGGSARLVVQAAESLPSALWEALAAARPVTLATRLGPEAPPATAAFGDALVAGSLGDAGLDERAQAAARELLADPRANRVTLGGGVRPGRDREGRGPDPGRHGRVGRGRRRHSPTSPPRSAGWPSRWATTRRRSGRLVGSGRRMRWWSPPATPAGDRTPCWPACAAGRSSSGRSAPDARSSDGPRRCGASAPATTSWPASTDRSGCDLGGRSPGETALAICAEILAVRSGRDLPGLRDRAGSIDT